MVDILTTAELRPKQLRNKEEALLTLDTNTSVALGRALNSIFEDKKLALIQGHLAGIQMLHPEPFLKGQNNSTESTQNMKDALVRLIDFMKNLQYAEKTDVVYDAEMHSPKFDFVGKNNLTSQFKLPDIVLAGEDLETVKNIILHNISTPLAIILETIDFIGNTASLNNESFREHCDGISRLAGSMNGKFIEQFRDPPSLKLVTDDMGKTRAIPILPTQVPFPRQ